MLIIVDKEALTLIDNRPVLEDLGQCTSVPAGYQARNDRVEHHQSRFDCFLRSTAHNQSAEASGDTTLAGAELSSHPDQMSKEFPSMYGAARPFGLKV